MLDQSAERLLEMIRGYWVSQIVGTLAKLGIPDRLGSSPVLFRELAENPSLWGTILEVSQVAPLARQAICERNLSSRCVVLEGDFFQAVPEADIHILKSIIHDWDDDQSIRILTNCARALRPNGRVILLESIVPEDGRPSYAPLSDLNMLVLLPGRERTASQYGALAEAAGLHLDRVIDTGSPVQILEISASPPR